MNFFDLVNISESTMDLVNPSTPEKILAFGERLGLEEGDRLIDFGCGFAEPLILWAQAFGITGLGIDIRPHACQRAQQKISTLGLEDRLEIICADAAAFDFEPGAFDAAICLGATFIWGGFGPAIKAMTPAIKARGRLGIGEVTRLQETLPEKLLQRDEEYLREIELYELAKKAGFTFAGIIRSSHEDWDRYESDNWQGLLIWLAENPDHPERDAVEQHLNKIQDDYLRYGRQYLGWAMYALHRARFGE